MATSDLGPDLDMITSMIRRRIDTQPKAARFSNTTTAAAGGLATLAGVAVSVAASNEIDLPGWAIVLITGVLLAAQVLGVRLTKNGWTPRQLDDFRAMQADAIDGAHFIRDTPEPARQEPASTAHEPPWADAERELRRIISMR